MAVFDSAVVITGGIATGKSTAASFFTDRGWTVIDADTIAHAVLDEQAEAIGRRFGSELIDGGHVDRKALGQIVFADAEKRRELEALLHPRIEEAIIRRAADEEVHGKPYLIDIPLFYERAAYPIERVVVVYAPRELQRSRLAARNGLSEAEVIQRIGAQMDIEEKRRRATWVIDNSGDHAQLTRECNRVRQLILDDFLV